jgi:hypothetical protein
VLELTASFGEVRVVDVDDALWGPVFEPLRADYGFLAVRPTRSWARSSGPTARV